MCRFGYVYSPQQAESALLLALVARTLEADFILCGSVQYARALFAARGRSGSGKRLPFAVSAGQRTNAKARSLRPAQHERALDHAIAVTAAAMDSSDLMLIKSFGPAEAAGRGFLPLIIAALERGLPVIVGVNSECFAAFQAFSRGRAERLPASPGQVIDWFLNVRHPIREKRDDP
ncbi:MAG: DUF2478 domain-containing protein [Roseinatronobacter sp.]